MKVYVSATFRDLEECRAAVRLALRRLRVEDMSMESYVAEDHRPLARCLAEVNECDVYVGIFAWRYGFVPPGHDRSITELEYRQALAGGKPCLIFLLDEEAPWPRRFVDRGRDADRIERLRAELSDRHMCSTFHDPADLAAMVTAAVANVQLDVVQPAQGLGTFRPDVVGQYFQRLRQHYGLLDLDALTPIRADDHLRIQLTSVFVEQWVREDPPPIELPREWLRRMQSEGRIGAEDLPEEVDPGELVHLHDSYRAKPLQRLFDVLGAPDQRAIVLLGDPGSGKSSAVRYLALSLTTGLLDNRLGALANHLPLLIELRSYITLVAEGRCDTFVDYLDYRAKADGLGIPRPVLLRHLRSGGRALMLVDGLDEVFDRRQRERVAEQIAAFAADHPQVRMIVTSRIIGYSRQILTSVGFTHYTLQDLDEEQIAEFLSSWYGPAAQTRPAEAWTRQDRLLDTMRQSSAIRELAGNPLLLTTLAIVGRHEPLPRERWKLYDHAATVLVEQWDVNRHLREQSQVAGFLDTEDKKELLRRLAWRMQSADRGLTVNYIDRAELGDVFEQYLIERYGHEPVTARVIALAMIDQFRERNFILSRYGPQVYGFVHRTFLEFFCADAILTRFQHDQVLSFDQLKELFRRHAADLSWREVLRLLTSAMSRAHAAALVEVLADGVQQSWTAGVPESPPWNLVLAVQCLAEIRRIDDSVATIADDLLRKVILLLEHGVGINDPGTEQLFEEEILPAARMIGSSWPGREVYLDWYRRRGVRLLWSPTITHATRLAVILSTRADGIEELMQRVLANIDDSRCAHAVVAGLVELAASPAGDADTARLRHQLVRRARDDGNASVRLAALQALAEQHGTDPEVRALLLDRSQADPSATVRAAGVQTLRDRFRGDPAARRVLLDRVRHDDNTGVRRTAVHALSETSEPDDELRQVLVECVLSGRDIEVLRIAVQALTDRFAAGAEVIGLLTERAGRDEDSAMRSAAVRLLGERSAESADVEQILIGRLREDSNPGVLRNAAQVLLEHFDTAAERVCAELVGRSRDDAVKGVRRTAAQLLVEHFGTDPTVRAVLAAISGRDPDPENRAAATKALAGWAASHQPSAQALLTLVTEDRDSGVRLAALEGLVEAGDAVAAESVLVDAARVDDDANVRAAAVRALALRCAGDPRLRKILVERLREDPHETVRTAAVQGSAHISPATWRCRTASSTQRSTTRPLPSSAAPSQP
ncbi:HEAT repeat domain-containing protein [Plantactinospora veratri]